MSQRDGAEKRAWVLAGLLLMILVGGIAELIRFRVEKGDAYPEYSTYRKDAVGAGVLYESLKLLPALEVQRQLRARIQDAEPRETVLFWLGADKRLEFTPETASFVEQGAHLVFSVGMKRSLAQSMDSDERRQRVERRTRSILGVTYQPLSVPDREKYEMNASSDDGPRASLMGFGQGGFVDLDPEWSVLYESSGVAIVIQRTFGEGLVTLLANSYPFSNECLLKESPVEFIEWILEGRRLVLFDETHLGVLSSPGMVGLLKRYRLGPLYFSFIVVGLLSVWRASASLLPKSGKSRTSEVMRNATPENSRPESISGVTGLIRRHVRRDQLFALCVQRWLSSAPHLSSREQHCQVAIEKLAKEKVQTEPELVALYRRAADEIGAKYK